MPIVTVPAPIPGTFYRRPSPNDPPFKSEGDPVAIGDPIGLIEVMKTFTQVSSDQAGRLKRFLVENEDPVQAGQPLCEIET
jgi:acetyl-CoA carboxylase biotin carboxyl carrier protein